MNTKYVGGDQKVTTKSLELRGSTIVVYCMLVGLKEFENIYYLPRNPHEQIQWKGMTKVLLLFKNIGR